MKKNRTTRIVTLLLIATLFTGMLPAAFAKESEPVKPEISSKLKQGTYFLLGIKERLAKGQAEKELLTMNVSKLEEMVADNSKMIRTLSEQLVNINQRIEANQRKALAIKIYIAELSNAVSSIKKEINEHKTHMRTVIAEVTSMLRNLYLQASILYAQNSPEEQILGLLANDSTLGNYSQKKQYALYINEATRALVAELEVASDAAQEKTDQLAQKQLIITSLEGQLLRESLLLDEMREARARLLTETQGKQELYEDLLKTSQQEEVNVSLEVTRLKENYSFFEQKLAQFKSQLESGTAQTDLESLESGLSLSQTALTDISQELKLLRGKTVLSWPVSPSLGISAFYHDSSYKAAMGVGHSAIDIRALQGTKVRAAADGVVSKAADNGFGYSYILITHPDKFVTLYGHVSEINVKEGQIVRQGEIIGLSGGMPGTKGAGWMTTGPHLHLEVFRNFQHINPLLYLPLEFLPKETLESKYVKELL